MGGGGRRLRLRRPSRAELNAGGSAADALIIEPPMRDALARTAACRLCGASFEQHGSGMRAYCERCTAKADRDVASAIDAECKECGGKFSTKNRLVRYCSDKCRIEGMRRRRREYMRGYMADPEKRAMYLARTRAAGASRRRAMEGKKPASGGGGGGGRRKGARAAGRPPRRPSMAKQRACELCGRSSVSYGRHARAHCKQCAARFDREVSRVLRAKCGECDKEFSPKSRNVRYCSTKCSAGAIRRRLREYAAGAWPTPSSAPSCRRARGYRKQPAGRGKSGAG